MDGTDPIVIYNLPQSVLLTVRGCFIKYILFMTWEILNMHGVEWLFQSVIV